VIAVGLHAIQSARPRGHREDAGRPWLGRLLRLLPLRP
jgi:hypothetical protein